MRVTSNSCIFVVYLHDMWLGRAFKESLRFFFYCCFSYVLSLCSALLSFSAFCLQDSSHLLEDLQVFNRKFLLETTPVSLQILQIEYRTKCVLQNSPMCLQIHCNVLIPWSEDFKLKDFKMENFEIEDLDFVNFEL